MTEDSQDETAESDTVGTGTGRDGSGRTPHERMERYVEVATTEQETRREKQTVLDRAEALEVPRDTAADRLQRLADLDVVDIASDGVYPDTNFSKF